jgi:hypothetical protein
MLKKILRTPLYMAKSELFDQQEFVKFLLKARAECWAGEGIRDSDPQRPGFKEFSFGEGSWDYRDSYAGYFMAPGQETVLYEGLPVWAMGYSGGMIPEHIGNVELAKYTFSFLKEALSRVDPERPFRGLANFEIKNWFYGDVNEGDIRQFRGKERIFNKGIKIFEQDYCGGLVIPKQTLEIIE